MGQIGAAGSLLYSVHYSNCVETERLILSHKLSNIHIKVEQHTQTFKFESQTPTKMEVYPARVDLGIFTLKNTIFTLNLHTFCWPSFFSLHMWKI